MGDRIYTKSEAIEKMEKSVKYYEVRIAAWQAVKRLRKKDGSNFATLSRNFDNCKFVQEYSSLYLKIYFRDETGCSTYDFINLGRNAYTDEKEATTADEVQERIDATIKSLEKWLEIDKRGAAEVADQIETMQPHLDEIKELLKVAENETNTHYVLRDYIKGVLNIH